MKLGLLFALVLAATPVLAQERPRDWVAPPIERIPNHRELWRQVVVELAAYAKKRNPNFVVLVRGGVELTVKGDREAEWEQARDPTGQDFEKRLPLGSRFRSYLKNLDGMIFNNLYCGPYRFDKPLAQAIRERRDLDAKLAEERAHGIRRQPEGQPTGPFSLDAKEELRRAGEIRRRTEIGDRQRRTLYALDAVRDNDLTVLSIEDCATTAEADAAMAHAARDKVLSFTAADDAALDRLPPGHAIGENASVVAAISSARNWLAMVHGDRFGSRSDWVAALGQTNFDAILIDVVHRGGDPLVKSDIAALKFKRLGATRMVLADLPIGKAYDWRWYWQKDWGTGNPPFLVAPIPDQPGAFITDLGDDGWKAVLAKYLVGIMDLGFDGVVLDDLDTYLWFEDLMPLTE